MHVFERIIHVLINVFNSRLQLFTQRTLRTHSSDMSLFLFVPQNVSESRLFGSCWSQNLIPNRLCRSDEQPLCESQTFTAVHRVI